MADRQVIVAEPLDTSKEFEWHFENRVLPNGATQRTARTIYNPINAPTEVEDYVPSDFTPAERTQIQAVLALIQSKHKSRRGY